jgi:glycerol uptake facilitator protein
MATRTIPLAARCAAEALGTFLLVFLGCGAVHVAVLTGALSGLWQIAIVWALGVALAIHLVGAVSGAHINPAITVAFAAWGRFSWLDVVPYIVSQVAGAYVAAAALFFLFGPFLAEKERQKGVTRGEPGSVVTAMCYGEFFPSPGKLAEGDGPYSREEHDRLNALVSEPMAFAAEALATLLLALMVFALTDERNAAAPPGRLAAPLIGLTVAALIVVFAPLTQACFNPARDLGPRLLAALAGWGNAAFGRGFGFLSVYIVAPIVGAVAGGGLYTLLLRPNLPVPDEEGK